MSRHVVVRAFLCLLVALGATAFQTPEAAAAPEITCANHHLRGTVCVATISVPGGGAGGGGPVCDPLDGCAVKECKLLYDDDSDFVDGLAWNGDPSVKPEPADAEVVTDKTNEKIAAMLSATHYFGSSRAGLADFIKRRLPAYGSMPTGIYAESGQWKECEEYHLDVTRDDDGNVASFPERITDSVTFGPVDITALIDPIELYEQARAEINPPEPPVQTAPPKDGLLFVKMPAWYWFEEGYWQDYTATATSPSKRLEVTVTAEPVMSMFDPGDASLPVLCLDGGREYIIGLDPWVGSKCQHIYKHSSTMAKDGSDTWVLDVEVLFMYSWEMKFDNGTINDRGVNDDETSTTSLPLQVGEIQSIITD